MTASGAVGTDWLTVQAQRKVVVREIHYQQYISKSPGDSVKKK
jgi:hypothetical protein